MRKRTLASTALLAVTVSLFVRLGTACAGEQALSAQQAYELLRSQLEDLRNLDSEWEAVRISSPEPEMVALITERYERRIAEVGDGPQAEAARNRLRDERDIRVEAFSNERKTPIRLRLRLADVSCYQATQSFVPQGEPSEYFVDGPRGFVLRHRSRTVTTLHNTWTTLAIIAPGIIQFHLAQAIATELKPVSLTQNGSSALLKLDGMHEKMTYAVNLEGKTLRPVFLQVFEEGRLVQQISATYPDESSPYPKEGRATRYSKDGAIESREDWTLKASRPMPMGDEPLPFMVPDGYAPASEAPPRRVQTEPSAHLAPIPNPTQEEKEIVSLLQVGRLSVGKENVKSLIYNPTKYNLVGCAVRVYSSDKRRDRICFSESTSISPRKDGIVKIEANLWG